jgi:hypothetical protein
MRASRIRNLAAMVNDTDHWNNGNMGTPNYFALIQRQNLLRPQELEALASYYQTFAGGAFNDT